MDKESRSNPETPPSELGAAEAITPQQLDFPESSPVEKTQDDSAAPHQSSRTCPTCGRSVDPGFRFCDGCGTRLEVAAQGAAPAVAPRAPVIQGPKPADVAAPAKPAAVAVPPGVPSPGIPVAAQKVPLIERWRRRRAERSELAEAERALAERPSAQGSLEAPHRLDETSKIEAPTAPPRLPGATSRPMTAEELRGARPVIGGRLQWTAEGETVTEEAPARPPVLPEPEVAEPWRPVPVPEKARRSRFPEPARFAFHLIVSFLSGAILLLVVAAVATIASDGSVAVFEMRGLPIFIGGATSIVVFAVLRTSGQGRAGPGPTRSSAIVSVLIGLVILVTAAALLYRPAIAARVQPRIERVLQVFGDEDAQAVQGFREDIVQWNEDSRAYQGLLRGSVRDGVNFDQFRGRAEESESALGDLVAQMRTHAEGAKHPELRDALDDLASVYDDQLGGLRLVNRGLLIDGFNLVQTGDRRFKDAINRAESLFRTRLRPLLDRAGYDPASFGSAISD